MERSQRSSRGSILDRMGSQQLDGISAIGQGSQELNNTASFINQVCIILVNSFVIPGCIMNRAGQEAQACAFSCFRARDIIVCSSGVCSVPFFALAISRVSLNSGLSRGHMCCHVFLPARVFPSGLGNTPVTEIGGSPFPHGGAILDVGRCTGGSVV